MLCVCSSVAFTSAFAPTLTNLSLRNHDEAELQNGSTAIHRSPLPWILCYLLYVLIILDATRTVDDASPPYLPHLYSLVQMHRADHKQASKQNGGRRRDGGGGRLPEGARRQGAGPGDGHRLLHLHRHRHAHARRQPGHARRRRGGRGERVALWFRRGASCSFDFHTPQHHTN